MIADAAATPGADRGGALHLFEGVGIELEYMIVDAATLAVRPAADALLAEVGGGYELEVELGDTAWSNELALHVIEIKTNGPARDLTGLGPRLAEDVRRIDGLLAPMGARLMPTAMHPWMDPERELRLWPHEASDVYTTFDRIFDCRGHGWANLQSMHINLPFAGDAELGRLHAAIRIALPILPALAASSPVADGAPTGVLDTRMAHYRDNARRVPSVTGRVIPEAVFSRADYEGALLRRIYDDLAPLDPDGVLRHEWVNARGCIARFDRSALEIRVIDVQECPAADIAVAGAVIAVVRALVEEHHASEAEQRGWHEDALAEILAVAIADAERAEIRDAAYLRVLGYPGRACTAGELWQHLIETEVSRDPGYAAWSDALGAITRHGTLARRILAATGDAPTADELRAVYLRLCDCLRAGELFGVAPGPGAGAR